MINSTIFLLFFQDYEGVETFIENSLETICGIGEVRAYIYLSL